MTELSYPDHRHNLGQWLNSQGLIGEGAEVGVLHGSFSKIVLDQWQGRLLHLIDPWEEQPEEVYRESLNKDINWTAAHKSMLGNIHLHAHRLKIHKMLSAEAVLSFEDGQLDFAYIDGNHSYEAVSEDLGLWWPKVRTGGILSGHDYYNNTEEGKHCMVKEALDRFMNRKLLMGHITPCTSWWIWKK